MARQLAIVIVALHLLITSQTGVEGLKWKRHHHHHHHHHDVETTTEATTSLPVAENSLDAIDNSLENSADLDDTLEDENDSEAFCEWHKCAKDLSNPRGFGKILDLPFLRKVFRNLNPFARPRLQMSFYLFKSDFPECGQELAIDDNSLQKSGFNVSHPTRIIIHGWMSQSRGSFNRDIKNAYLSRGDYNIIVADWSASASNLNYFSVVNMIEGFGIQVAEFTKHLHNTLGVSFDDIYLIGHSLGAQIAGAAGKRVRPHKFNTIFALDPAGPKFRHRGAECRIDPTDAKYVESIQTSANLGFLEPTGSATFYPNYGVYQNKCYYIGCSHIRAYKMFAESITTRLGFWGTSCDKQKKNWNCNETMNALFQMGGEPSQHKAGVFYVKTSNGEPFALGKEV